jgi:hypothetical protein
MRHGLDACGPVVQELGRFRGAGVVKQDDFGVLHVQPEILGLFEGLILRNER